MVFKWVAKQVERAVETVVNVGSQVIGAAGDLIESGAQLVGDVIQGAGKAVVKAVKQGVKAVERISRETVEAVESIGKFIQPLVERYAIQVALVSMGIPPQFAAPMSAGMHTIARGGSPEDAIKSAATVVVIDKVGASVATAAKDAGFTANEVAFAQSAAQSAVATAAYGGDINTVLQAAAIGGVSGVAGTSVLNETKNAKLAAFTESAVESALRGQKIDQAILDGASAATITYMREIKAEQDKADAAVKQRDAAYNDYVNQVNEYNALLERYNAATDQETVDNIAVQLDARLVRINQASENIGRMNQQLADMQTKVNDLTKKATAEVEKTGGDYAEKIINDLTEEERVLVARIQEAAQREFGDEEAIQFVSYETPTAPDGYAPGDFVGDPKLRMIVDENYNVIDADTGEVINIKGLIYNVKPEFRKRPVRALIDLRQYAGGEGRGGTALIGGGGTATQGASPTSFAFIGYDKGTGAEKYSLFDEPFTLIVLEGGKSVLKSDIAPIFLEPIILQDNQLKLNPVELVETAPNQFETVPVEEKPTEELDLERIPGRIGGGGGGTYSRVLEELTNVAGSAAAKSEEANSILQNAMLKQQFYARQAQLAQDELQRLANLRAQAEQELQRLVTPESINNANKTISDIDAETKRVQEVTNTVNQKLNDAKNEVAAADEASKSAEQELNQATSDILLSREQRVQREQDIAAFEQQKAKVAAESDQRLLERLAIQYTQQLAQDEIARKAAIEEGKKSLQQRASEAFTQFVRAQQIAQQVYKDPILQKDQKRLIAESRRVDELVRQAKIKYDELDQQARAVKEEEDRAAAEQKRIADQQKAKEDEYRRAAEAALTQEREAARLLEEINRIRTGRGERTERALLARFEKELADYEKQLVDLERQATEQTRTAETAAEQARFGAGQVGRLRSAGRLTGELLTDIEAEIASLMERSEQARTAAREAATKREGLVAPQQKESAARGISEREVINLLGLGEGEAREFGFLGEGETIGGGEAVQPGAGAGEGAGVGAGEGEGVGPGEGEGTEIKGEDRVRAFTTVLGEPRVRTAGEQVSTLSPRVTGEALVGILGEKEPLFGGDEDEQRAVWNRRSLRLRRALGL